MHTARKEKASDDARTHRPRRSSAPPSEAEGIVATSNNEARELSVRPLHSLSSLPPLLWLFARSSGERNNPFGEISDLGTFSIINFSQRSLRTRKTAPQSPHASDRRIVGVGSPACWDHAKSYCVAVDADSESRRLCRCARWTSANACTCTLGSLPVASAEEQLSPQLRADSSMREGHVDECHRACVRRSHRYMHELARDDAYHVRTQCTRAYAHLLSKCEESSLIREW